jgi:small nuclear ribonucleoprotein
MTNKPLDILNESLKSSVIVKIKGNREFRGILEGYDIHMNLLLSDAEELNENASAKNSKGEILLRGDNVVYISPTVKKEGEKQHDKEVEGKETW